MKRAALIALLICAPLDAQMVKGLLSTNPIIETNKGTELRFDKAEFDFPIKTPPVPGPGIFETYETSILQAGAFIAPVSGIYAAHGQIGYAQNGEGIERSLYIVKHAADGTTLDNIAIIETSCLPIRNVNMISLQVHGFTHLERGQYLTFNAYQNSGAPLAVIAAASWAMVEKIK